MPDILIAVPVTTEEYQEVVEAMQSIYDSFNVDCKFTHAGSYENSDMLMEIISDLLSKLDPMRDYLKNIFENQTVSNFDINTVSKDMLLDLLKITIGIQMFSDILSQNAQHTLTSNLNGVLQHKDGMEVIRKLRVEAEKRCQEEKSDVDSENNLTEHSEKN